MNYVGIDIHKRYSVLVAVDARGRELARGRINGNTAFGFAQFFAGLEGPSKVVLEACWNWGRIYDLLSEIEQVEEVVLAHPLKTRLIADALKMPPPMTPAAFPLVMVSPEIVTSKPEVISNTRLAALPFIASKLAPGPVIVRFLSISSSPLIRNVSCTSGRATSTMPSGSNVAV